MRRASFLHVFFAVCFASIAPAFADDGGISVSGVGIAKGRPTVVEINTRIVGEADVAADADARAKAERIAKVSGVKLGRVLLVRDAATSQEGNQLLLAAIYSSAASATPESKEVQSAAMAEIPVTVRITVKFEIEKQ